MSARPEWALLWVRTWFRARPDDRTSPPPETWFCWMPGVTGPLINAACVRLGMKASGIWYVPGALSADDWEERSGDDS
jgi:hypothetical protein